jgi:hypothetical protein
MGLTGCGARKEKPKSTLLEEDMIEVIMADTQATEAEESSEAMEEMAVEAEVEEAVEEIEVQEMRESETGLSRVYTKADLEETEEAETEAEEMPGKLDAEEMAEIQRKIEQFNRIEPATVKVKAMNEIRIKVLNGNGKRNSARAMRGKLEASGYTVERVDNAPSSNFSKNVVFYANGFDKEAKALANTVGGVIVTKPLTWHSIFDLIVVTGKMQ